jgi:hypothetical protein
MEHTPVISYKNNWERHEYYADGKPLSQIRQVEIGKELKSFIVPVNSFRDTRHYSDMGHPGSSTSTQFTVTMRDEMLLIPNEIPLSHLLSLGFFVKLIDGEFSKQPPSAQV